MRYSVQMEHRCVESKPDPVQIVSMTRPLLDHALRGRQRVSISTLYFKPRQPVF